MAAEAIYLWDAAFAFASLAKSDGRMLDVYKSAIHSVRLGNTRSAKKKIRSFLGNDVYVDEESSAALRLVYAAACKKEKKYSSAAKHLVKALETVENIRLPESCVHLNLGCVLAADGRTKAASVHTRKAALLLSSSIRSSPVTDDHFASITLFVVSLHNAAVESGTMSSVADSVRHIRQVIEMYENGTSRKVPDYVRHTCGLMERNCVLLGLSFEEDKDIVLPPLEESARSMKPHLLDGDERKKEMNHLPLLPGHKSSSWALPMLTVSSFLATKQRMKSRFLDKKSFKRRHRPRSDGYIPRPPTTEREPSEGKLMSPILRLRRVVRSAEKLLGRARRKKTVKFVESVVPDVSGIGFSVDGFESVEMKDIDGGFPDIRRDRDDDECVEETVDNSKVGEANGASSEGIDDSEKINEEECHNEGEQISSDMGININEENKTDDNKVDEMDIDDTLKKEDELREVKSGEGEGEVCNMIDEVDNVEVVYNEKNIDVEVSNVDNMEYEGELHTIDEEKNIDTELSTVDNIENEVDMNTEKSIDNEVSNMDNTEHEGDVHTKDDDEKNIDNEVSNMDNTEHEGDVHTKDDDEVSNMDNMEHEGDVHTVDDEKITNSEVSNDVVGDSHFVDNEKNVDTEESSVDIVEDVPSIDDIACEQNDHNEKHVHFEFESEKQEMIFDKEEEVSESEVNEKDYVKICKSISSVVRKNLISRIFSLWCVRYKISSRPKDLLRRRRVLLNKKMFLFRGDLENRFLRRIWRKWRRSLGKLREEQRRREKLLEEKRKKEEEDLFLYSYEKTNFISPKDRTKRDGNVGNNVSNQNTSMSFVSFRNEEMSGNKDDESADNSSLSPDYVFDRFCLSNVLFSNESNVLKKAREVKAKTHFSANSWRPFGVSDKRKNKIKEVDEEEVISRVVDFDTPVHLQQKSDMFEDILTSKMTAFDAPVELVALTEHDGMMSESTPSKNRRRCLSVVSKIEKSLSIDDDDFMNNSVILTPGKIGEL